MVLKLNRLHQCRSFADFVWISKSVRYQILQIYPSGICQLPLWWVFLYLYNCHVFMTLCQIL